VTVLAKKKAVLREKIITARRVAGGGARLNGKKRGAHSQREKGKSVNWFLERSGKVVGTNQQGENEKH